MENSDFTESETKTGCNKAGLRIDASKLRRASEKRVTLPGQVRGTARSVTVDCPGKDCSKCPGCVSGPLVYLPIYDDFWPDANGAITHQFEWQEFNPPVADRVVEIEREFKIPLDTVVDGTLPDPNAIVYGYNDDQTLDINGGKAKSYNPCYDHMSVRYHGALEAKYPFGIGQKNLTFLTPNAIKNYADRIVSYYSNRGWDFPAPDTFKQFSDQYIWQLAEGQWQFVNFSTGYVAMRVIWEDKCKKNSKVKRCVPKYIDLIASATGTYWVIDTFEPDVAKRQNGHAYPVRIPITTDFCGKFQQKYNVSPIAYYDCKCNVLTVHVPEIPGGYLLLDQVIDADSRFDFATREHLLAFDGSFALFNKDCVKGITPSGFNNLSLFAQVSEEVFIKSLLEDAGADPVELETVWPIRSAVFAPDDETVFYTGMVFPYMSGTSPALDIFALPFRPANDISTYIAGLDPFQYPATCYCNQKYEQGDTPLTKIVEKYSATASITALECDGVWNQLIFQLPYDVITATTSFPENASTTAAPITVSNETAFTQVMMHEFAHNAQYSAGMIIIVGGEAMATGVEMDPKSTPNLFSVFRERAFAQAHLRLTRGVVNMATTDEQGELERRSYGIGMFWHYVRAQFDTNMQLQRRMLDIMTADALGPTMRARDIPDAFHTLGINTVGPTACLRDALQQLYSRDIKELWNNFSIAVVLLRNNTSIPPEYRVDFPYWIWNTDYAGYPTILTAATFINQVQFADWWEKMDENQIVPANYRVPSATGQTFIRTLPAQFQANLRSLRTVSFNVPRETNTITISILQGEWRLSLLQFTSDGTPVGTFIIDGPHTVVSGDPNYVFNLADITNHDPQIPFTANGNLRLVCANVTFSGTGANLDEYFQLELPNGRISIVSS